MRTTDASGGRAADSRNGGNGVRDLLLDRLTLSQAQAVRSAARRVLVLAGAGSGKTEVMARRIAWWVAVEGVPKDAVVAFTFTERAAEEMKFRIRQQIQRVTPEGADATLGGMYVGTIHGFCIKLLRELKPNEYHNFDVVDEGARLALVDRGYFRVLGLSSLEQALSRGHYATIDAFLTAYDLLHECDAFDVELPSSPPPYDPAEEREWCRDAVLLTDVGMGEPARAFADAAARYYAYLRCRRFLDFSTSQTELLRVLRADPNLLDAVRNRLTHVVVDELQDINDVQDHLIRLLVGDAGSLTAVGDHRQAIYGWRGGRVDLMAALHEELRDDPAGEVVDLRENFRSTPRIIDLANRWADSIDRLRSMATPAMAHGNAGRHDFHSTHVGVLAFDNRADEAEWIGEQIRRLIPGDGTGAAHDTRDGERGLTYSDIAILIRSSTDARTYMRALQRRGIPAVFRAGPDLFSQPEVLLFVAAMAAAAGLEQFYGGEYDPKSLPNRIRAALDCPPEPAAVVYGACDMLRNEGLAVADDAASRILLAADLIRRRIEGTAVSHGEAARVRTPALREWVTNLTTVRRVFPQALYQLLLAEAEIGEWDTESGRGAAAMFHLGQLSSLILSIETPGWTSADEFKYQIIALYLWGSQNARTEEAPLLVPPDAVTISTVHAVKGLEFAAVFLADVCARRFPSQFARRTPRLPFDGPILDRIRPSELADNDNYNGERRLMYVALTRAERYLFVTASGAQQSRFFTGLAGLIRDVGGTTAAGPADLLGGLRYATSELRREDRLVTSFSDLRYYLECPHDFYLRKVLGFAPTIDQAFGYGRGVHNLLRAVHNDPKSWAELARDPSQLRAAVESLVGQGLFYLRYTTGEPAENMRRKAVRIVSDYVRLYAGELAELEFEPEREFETLIEEEQVLISGAIDVVRRDDPPRVTIIDFKSGEPESDVRTKLDEDEMRLQVTVYGLAAKHELEYEPESGLVRYLDPGEDGKGELRVELDGAALTEARGLVAATAREIRERRFHGGPRRGPKREGSASRCAECDFRDFCGMPEASRWRGGRRSR